MQTGASLIAEGSTPSVTNYSFREDKSKLKNRSMPVCISLDLSSYEKGRDTKEAKRSIKVTRKVGAQVSHEFVQKSVTHSLVQRETCFNRDARVIYRIT